MYLPLPASPPPSAFSSPPSTANTSSVSPRSSRSSSFSRALVFSDAAEPLARPRTGSPTKVRPSVRIRRVFEPNEALQALHGLPNEPPSPPTRPYSFELGRRMTFARIRHRPRRRTQRATRPRQSRDRLAALNQTAAAQQDFARALARDCLLYPALLNLRQLGMPLPDTGTCRFTAPRTVATGPEVPSRISQSNAWPRSPNHPASRPSI